MLVDSTSIPLRNLQSSPPASCHVSRSMSEWYLFNFDFVCLLVKFHCKHKIYHPFNL